MKEGINISEHRGHLKEGVKPIFVCIGTLEDFRKSKEFDEESFKKADYSHLDNNFGLVNRDNDNLENIDWFGKEHEFQENGFLHAGEGTYVMSQVNGSNKMSDAIFSCTSLIVGGIEQGTNKNISFLTHQVSTPRFLNKAQFLNDLKLRLDEVKDKCIPQTVDAVILGGHTDGGLAGVDYHQAVDLISEEVQSFFTFKPKIINGPKTIAHEEDVVFYDNDNRRVYFIRPEINQEKK
ncbi:MAG: hypothetical protein KGL67_03020 [Patescibacteria group bacterium]|nr:hypothetical protein [Patescibacteria group bacterium]